MNRFNSQDVSLLDCINYMERDVEHKEKTKDAKKLQGSSSFFIDHNLAVAKAIRDLLKRFKRNPQMDFEFELKKLRR